METKKLSAEEEARNAAVHIALRKIAESDEILDSLIIRDVWDAGLQFARQWVPVSERLPDAPGYYLATFVDPIGFLNVQLVTYLGSGNWEGPEMTDPNFEKLTAWMEVPLPFEYDAEASQPYQPAQAQDSTSTP